MINFKKKIKKLGAGIMASLCAASMIGTSIGGTAITAGAALSTENNAFPSADAVIAQADFRGTIPSPLTLCTG